MAEMTSEITELLAQAMRAIQYGHKPAAAAYLNRILEIDPDNMDAWRWLAECMPNQSKRDYCLERAGLSASSVQSRPSAYQRTSAMVSPSSLADNFDNTMDSNLAEKHAQRNTVRGQKRAELPPHYHTAISVDIDRPKARQNVQSGQTNVRRPQNPPVVMSRRQPRKPHKGLSIKGMFKSMLVVALFTLAGYFLFSTGLTTGERVWNWITLQIENNISYLPFSGMEASQIPDSPYDQPAEEASVLATFFPTPMVTQEPLVEANVVGSDSQDEQGSRASAEVPVESVDTDESSAPTAEPAPADPSDIVVDDSAQGYAADGAEELDSNTVTFDEESVPANAQPSEANAPVNPVGENQADVAQAAPLAETAPVEVAPAAPPSQPTGFVDGPNVIGQSVKGNNIEVIQFGNGPVERMMVAGVHGGNEWNTTALADQLIEYIRKNPQVIPADRTLYILRLLNPDGEARGHNLDGRTNERGVDLNRNWDAYWVIDWPRDGCWNYRPISAGSSAFSEPETVALRDFIQSHNISALINYHSAALGLFAGGRPPETESIRLAKSIAAVTNYAYPPEDTGCDYTGQFTDWLAMNGIAAVDLELTNHTDTDFDENLKVLNVLMKWEPLSGQKTLTGLINIAQSIPENPSTIQQIKKFGAQALNKINGIIFGLPEEK